MAAGRIMVDAQGRLVVPDEPTIPVAVGDGAGVECWRVVRPLAEEAILQAFGGRKRAHFLEVPAGERAARELNDHTPPSTVNAFRLYRVGLNGGQRPLASDPEVTLPRELKSLLDLHLAFVALPGGPLVVHDVGEAPAPLVELPAGSARALRFLELCEAHAPSLAGALRFGTVGAVDRHHAGREELEPGAVEATVALVPTSRLGTERLILGATRLAKAFGHTQLVLVESDTTPALTYARRVTARLALQTLPEDERPELEEARAVTIPARLAREKLECLVAAEREGRQLVSALAPAFGGRRALAQGELNLASGHALFGPREPEFDHAQPAALLVAMRLLLSHLGWDEAAARLGGRATGAAA